MGSFSYSLVLLGLFIGFGNCRRHNHDTGERLHWPINYHFNSEEIDLMSGVVKSIEVWVSHEHHRSRLDMYGGTTKRIYYSPVYERYGHHQRGKIFMYNPETTDDEVPVTKCTILPSYYGDYDDILPPPYMDYEGQAERDGKNMSVWKMERTYRDVFKGEATLYVYEDEVNDVDIPYELEIKTFDLAKGSLKEHTIRKYYNYDSDVSFKYLEADETGCEEHDYGNEAFPNAMKRLNYDIPHDVTMAFHSYKKHHNKNYEKDEHEMRKKIFEMNWRYITEHNKKNLGFTMGFNQFVDQTDEELEYLAATRFTGPIRGTHPFPHTLEEIESMADELPKEVDLRAEGIISPINNQAGCGSCWAFATAAALEGALARANGGNLIDLSEQSLVDCAWQFTGHGCGGAEDLNKVWDYVLKNGVPTSSEYGPYLEEDGVCKIHNMTKVYGIKGYVPVTPGSPNALKAALHLYGPVEVGIGVVRSMKFYEGGVYYGMDCESYILNHAVTVVGYGEQDGELYWIVKNSWGESWGADGYINMSAKDNNCNVMTFPVYPIV